MTLRMQRYLRISTLVALLLLGVWVGIGLVHEHTGAPTCQVCNALHYNSADLVTPIQVVRPESVVRLESPSELAIAATPYLPTPPGRAPPLV